MSPNLLSLMPCSNVSAAALPPPAGFEKERTMAAQFQPAIVSYGKNSCIMVEGRENTGRFYIIQKGKVRISREADELADLESNLAGPGDIIGAVSVMASHSYIETIETLTDVTLLAVERDRFGDLIRDNTPIALSIIQQFSQRLRSLDESLSRRTLNAAGANDPSHLYQVAEYYERQKKYNQAFYAYQRYAAYCPQGEYAGTIKEKMKAIAPRVKTVKPGYAADQLKRSYPRDTLLLVEGETGDELYIIQSGLVKITKIVDNQEMVLAVLKAGDILGEMSLLENKPRAATAEVYEDCTVYALNRVNFDRMIRENPDLIARITTTMAERIWLIYKQLANTLIDNPLGRVYDALGIQLEKERVGLKGNQSWRCNFGVTELAGMAGIPASESDEICKKLILGKTIFIEEGKIFIPNTEDVFRQAAYYKRGSKAVL
jgi:CRP-like cAMP-binding protein